MTLPEATLVDSLYNGPMHPRNRSPPDNPSSYLRLSDLRTGSKRKRESSSVDLSTPSSPRSEWDFGLQVISGLKHCFGDGGERADQALCVDCVVDCDDADCQASPEEQCTDHCIGIPCEITDECAKICTEEACPEKPCEGGKECMGTLDESVSNEILVLSSLWSRCFNAIIFSFNYCAVQTTMITSHRHVRTCRQDMLTGAVRLMTFWASIKSNLGFQTTLNSRVPTFRSIPFPRARKFLILNPHHQVFPQC